MTEVLTQHSQPSIVSPLSGGAEMRFARVDSITLPTPQPMPPQVVAEYNRLMESVQGIKQQREQSAEEIYNDLMNRIKNHPDSARIRASIAARLIDDLGVLNKDADAAIHDTIHPDQHKHEQVVVSKWSHASVGANAVVTYQDVDSGETYVLLAQKYNVKDAPELGLSPVLEIPGGHMDAKPALGGNVSDYDFNLSKTAARELKEETGLALSDQLATSLGALSDDKRVIESSRQGVEENFHFHMKGHLQDLPQVQGKDDIAASFWVKLSDLSANHSLGRQDRDSGKWRYHARTPEGNVLPIRDDLGEAIDTAAQRLGVPLREEQPSAMVGAGTVSTQSRISQMAR